MSNVNSKIKEQAEASVYEVIKWAQVVIVFVRSHSFLVIDRISS